MNRIAGTTPTNAMALLVAARRSTVASLRLTRMDVAVIAGVRDGLQLIDAADELVEHETEWSRHDELAAQLEAIDAAIDRFATDRYGLCIECGEPVGVEQLQAVPWATACLRHAD